MKTKRFWIELVGLSSAIAVALAFLIATLGVAAAGASGTTDAQPIELGFALQDSKPAPQPQVAPAAMQPQENFSKEIPQREYAGMVTCSRCGAKHSAKSGMTATDCTRACVRSGSVFSLIDGDKTYTLEGDPTIIKKFAGQRARVIGAVEGNKIRVSSVSSES